MMRNALATSLLLSALLLAGCGVPGLGGRETSDWALQMTQLDDTPGDGTGVRIAILDTGINVGHPSLKHLVDGNPDNGELVAFKDFIDGKGDTVAAAFDDDGHGSHVTGILAGAGKDTIGGGSTELPGSARGAHYLVARVCSGETCDGQAIVDGVTWARQNNADIISMSLGGQGGLPPAIAAIVQDDLTAAINRAIDQGIVVVAAAGNDGPENADVNSPGSIPGVIAVGAVDRDGHMADFSSRGDDGGNPCLGIPTLPLPLQGVTGRCDPDKKPELVAPGVDIVSAWTGSDYYYNSGTSQATPFVTGAVARLLGEQPNLTSRSDVLAVKQALISTAKPLEGQALPHDEAAGYGLLQAHAAYDAWRAR